MTDSTNGDTRETMEGPSSVNSKCVIVVGMAGSGKTSVVQRLLVDAAAKGQRCFLINLDPAVGQLPFGVNVDIRNTVNYSKVMEEYKLGPNGAIMTSLNLFVTKFDQVLSIIDKRKSQADLFIVDTPGQIEVFAWSASGQIVTQTMASSLPTVILYAMDGEKCSSPIHFMSNMLYASGVMTRLRLPFIAAFNKSDKGADKPMEWIKDYTKFKESIDEGQEFSYSLARSLAIALDDVYSAMRCIKMSAVTGDGMDQFWPALDSAVQEFHEETIPAMMHEKKELEMARLNRDTGLGESKTLEQPAMAGDPSTDIMAGPMMRDDGIDDNSSDSEDEHVDVEDSEARQRWEMEQMYRSLGQR